MILINIK